MSEETKAEPQTAWNEGETLKAITHLELSRLQAATESAAASDWSDASTALRSANTLEKTRVHLGGRILFKPGDLDKTAGKDNMPPPLDPPSGHGFDRPRGTLVPGDFAPEALTAVEELEARMLALAAELAQGDRWTAVHFLYPGLLQIDSLRRQYAGFTKEAGS